MKKFFLIISIFCICKTGKTQNQNTDPNPPPTVTQGTGLPTQSGPPYDGSNPVITNPGYTLAPPPNLNMPDPAPSVNYTDPTGPAYQGNPNKVASPAPTVTNTPAPKINRLFQDPMKTPKNPGKTGRIGNVDGSSGKYKSDHPLHNSSGFAKHHKHIKTAKSHTSKSGTYERTGNNAPAAK